MVIIFPPSPFFFLLCVQYKQVIYLLMGGIISIGHVPSEGWWHRRRRRRRLFYIFLKAIIIIASAAAAHGREYRSNMTWEEREKEKGGVL